jgi:hypothetical protein
MHMKIKGMFLLSIFSLLAFVGIASARPTNLSTPYSNSEFSARFNGSVTLNPKTQDKSTEVIYESNDGQVYQGVVVRHVSYDLAVTPANADWYADNDSMPTGDVTSNRSSGTYQGRFYTYLYHTYTFEGVEYTKRVRNIVVNAREVIFIWQIGPTDLNDRDQWVAFEDTLNIQ